MQQKFMHSNINDLHEALSLLLTSLLWTNCNCSPIDHIFISQHHQNVVDVACPSIDYKGYILHTCVCLHTFWRFDMSLLRGNQDFIGNRPWLCLQPMCFTPSHSILWDNSKHDEKNESKRTKNSQKVSKNYQIITQEFSNLFPRRIVVL